MAILRDERTTNPVIRIKVNNPANRTNSTYNIPMTDQYVDLELSKVFPRIDNITHRFKDTRLGQENITHSLSDKRTSDSVIQMQAIIDVSSTDITWRDPIFRTSGTLSERAVRAYGMQRALGSYLQESELFNSWAEAPDSVFSFDAIERNYQILNDSVIAPLVAAFDERAQLYDESGVRPEGWEFKFAQELSHSERFAHSIFDAKAQIMVNNYNEAIASNQFMLDNNTSMHGIDIRCVDYYYYSTRNNHQPQIDAMEKLMEKLREENGYRPKSLSPEEKKTSLGTYSYVQQQVRPLSIEDRTVLEANIKDLRNKKEYQEMLLSSSIQPFKSRQSVEFMRDENGELVLSGPEGQRSPQYRIINDQLGTEFGTNIAFLGDMTIDGYKKLCDKRDQIYQKTLQMASNIPEEVPNNYESMLARKQALMMVEENTKIVDYMGQLISKHPESPEMRLQRSPSNYAEHIAENMNISVKNEINIRELFGTEASYLRYVDSVPQLTLQKISTQTGGTNGLNPRDASENGLKNLEAAKSYWESEFQKALKSHKGPDIPESARSQREELKNTIEAIDGLINHHPNYLTEKVLTRGGMIQYLSEHKDEYLMSDSRISQLTNSMAENLKGVDINDIFEKIKNNNGTDTDLKNCEALGQELRDALVEKARYEILLDTMSQNRITFPESEERRIMNEIYNLGISDKDTDATINSLNLGDRDTWTRAEMADVMNQLYEVYYTDPCWLASKLVHEREVLAAFKDERAAGDEPAKGPGNKQLGNTSSPGQGLSEAEIECLHKIEYLTNLLDTYYKEKITTAEVGIVIDSIEKSTVERNEFTEARDRGFNYYLERLRSGELLGELGQLPNQATDNSPRPISENIDNAFMNSMSKYGAEVDSSVMQDFVGGRFRGSLMAAHIQAVGSGNDAEAAKLEHIIASTDKFVKNNLNAHSLEFIEEKKADVAQGVNRLYDALQNDLISDAMRDRTLSSLYNKNSIDSVFESINSDIEHSAALNPRNNPFAAKYTEAMREIKDCLTDIDSARQALKTTDNPISTDYSTALDAALGQKGFVVLHSTDGLKLEQSVNKIQEEVFQSKIEGAIFTTSRGQGILGDYVANEAVVTKFFKDVERCNEIIEGLTSDRRHVALLERAIESAKTDLSQFSVEQQDKTWGDIDRMNQVLGIVNAGIEFKEQELQNIFAEYPPEVSAKVNAAVVHTTEIIKAVDSYVANETVVAAYPGVVGVTKTVDDPSATNPNVIKLVDREGEAAVQFDPKQWEDARDKFLQTLDAWKSSGHEADEDFIKKFKDAFEFSLSDEGKKRIEEGSKEVIDILREINKETESSTQAENPTLERDAEIDTKEDKDLGPEEVDYEEKTPVVEERDPFEGKWDGEDEAAADLEAQNDIESYEPPEEDLVNPGANPLREGGNDVVDDSGIDLDDEI